MYEDLPTNAPISAYVALIASLKAAGFDADVIASAYADYAAALERYRDFSSPWEEIPLVVEPVLLRRLEAREPFPPVTPEAMAELIEEGRRDFPLRPFAPLPAAVPPG